MFSICWCNNHFTPSNPAANQGPTLAELPAADQRPTLAELPAANQRPTLAELPAANQRPTLAELPAANQRPTLAELPAANQRPTLAELSAADQRPTLAELPAANQRPTLAELPAANQGPTLAQLQRFTVNGELVNIITDVADNWKCICVAFNFDPAGRTLKSIEKQFQNVPKDCCIEMFQTWLKTKDATWKHLITALESSGESRLADFVKTYAGITQGEACAFSYISFDKILFTRQT